MRYSTLSKESRKEVGGEVEEVGKGEGEGELVGEGAGEVVGEEKEKSGEKVCLGRRETSTPHLAFLEGKHVRKGEVLKGEEEEGFPREEREEREPEPLEIFEEPELEVEEKEEEEPEEELDEEDEEEPEEANICSLFAHLRRPIFR